MKIVKRLFSRIVAFMSVRPLTEERRQLIASLEESNSIEKPSKMPTDFNGDYRSASDILRDRIYKRFPDNYHGRVGSNANSARDFSNERAAAIDASSAAIAAALRRGATVRQAADAGAASVGI